MTRQNRWLAKQRAAKTKISGKTQVFTYEGADGVKRVLNVEAMRVWAESNLEVEGVYIDINKIEDMLKNGRIDREYLLNHKIQGAPEPILVCMDFVDDRSEIVDGNHTYVAMALALATAAEMGINMPGPQGAPAYVFEREQWTRFLV